MLLLLPLLKYTPGTGPHACPLAHPGPCTLLDYPPRVARHPHAGAILHPTRFQAVLLCCQCRQAHKQRRLQCRAPPHVLLAMFWLSQSRPSYRPSPLVAQHDWMYLLHRAEKANRSQQMEQRFLMLGAPWWGQCTLTPPQNAAPQAQLCPCKLLCKLELHI